MNHLPPQKQNTEKVRAGQDGGDLGRLTSCGRNLLLQCSIPVLAYRRPTSLLRKAAPFSLTSLLLLSNDESTIWIQLLFYTISSFMVSIYQQTAQIRHPDLLSLSPLLTASLLEIFNYDWRITVHQRLILPSTTSPTLFSFLVSFFSSFFFYFPDLYTEHPNSDSEFEMDQVV